jgi:1-phosphofructokinase family hexose kinase
MAIVTVGFNPAIDRVLECPDFHIGGHQAAKQIARLAAGKAANVSRALALLGSDSIATGFIGTNEIEFFLDQLMALGPGRVLCHFVEVSGKTRENISILDPRRRVETHLRDRGFAIDTAEAALLHERMLHDVRTGDTVVFAGSLCDGVTDEMFERLIETCTARGARVVVDSSGTPLKVAVRHKLLMVKPNLEELRDLLGREVPNAASAVRDAAREVLPHVENVLVSRGAAGAVLVTAGGAYSARVQPSGPIIRTVSCGDHLLAGFVAENILGRDPEGCLRAALGVATARAQSTDMGEFDVNVARALALRVEVEKI